MICALLLQKDGDALGHKTEVSVLGLLSTAIFQSPVGSVSIPALLHVESPVGLLPIRFSLFPSKSGRFATHCFLSKSGSNVPIFIWYIIYSS